MFAIMCRKAHIIRVANIIRRSRHHLPKANIIQKSLICLVDKCSVVLTLNVIYQFVFVRYFPANHFYPAASSNFCLFYRLDYTTLPQINQGVALYIIRNLLRYIINTGVVYHHCERVYSLRLMICTYGDDIHAKT